MEVVPSIEYSVETLFAELFTSVPLESGATREPVLGNTSGIDRVETHRWERTLREVDIIR